MQTFVPLESFEETVRVLDRQRLGKQRVEAWQILSSLLYGGGWKNHPAVRMWSGYEPALKQYLRQCILEWERRGYRNTIPIPVEREYVLPHWWYGPIHASHRAALLQKNPAHYRQFGWIEEPRIAYVWPQNNPTWTSSSGVRADGS